MFLTPKTICLTVVLTLGGALTAHAQILKITDVSPDQSTFSYAVPALSTPAGRMKSLVIDPNNDAILYAGAEFSGVWKSTTGFKSGGPNFGADDATKMTWFQSSNGLRNGLTQNQYSLAVDPSVTGADSDGHKYSKRLLYASSSDDGRPGRPYGGLWVSTDAAGNWTQVALCGPDKDDISSVIFSGGQPFVDTQCGIWTTTSADLTSSWSQLKTLPIVLGGAFMVDGGGGTFFACMGTWLFPASNAGEKWGLGVTLPGKCLALAAVPNAGKASDQVLVVRSDTTTEQEVTLVDFGKSPPTMKDLGFGAVANNNGGSGAPAIAAALRIPGVPIPSPTPGFNYDVYAADSCAWFEYNPIPIPKVTPAWQMVAEQSSDQCHGDTTKIHADTWAMVFPSWYNTFLGACAAYAATDGGVFFTGGMASLAPGFLPNCATVTWYPAQGGLHALENQRMSVITQGSLPYASSFPLAIYMPTGDNDVFVSHLANCNTASGHSGSCSFLPTAWQNLNASGGHALGDAGLVVEDPYHPQQVLEVRNGHYVVVDDPPLPAGPSTTAGTYTEIYEPSPPLPTGAQLDAGTGSGGITEIYTLPGETPGIPTDYLAVQDDSPQVWESSPPAGCDATKHDHILRNTSGTPPVATSWSDLSDFFLACDVVKVQPSGGHLNPIVYAMTNLANDSSLPKISYPPPESGQTYGPQQIYRGVVVSLNDVPGTGKIKNWVSVMGSGSAQLKEAEEFFVNPYDASEIYALDLQDKVIMHTTNGGASWAEDNTLTDLATNHGEYDLGCYSSVGRPVESASDPFTNVCSLGYVAFDPFWPQARAAAMLYGGIAFSRDSGAHWIPLNVNDNNHFLSNNLTTGVNSVFIDAETQIPGLPANNQTLYAGLHGYRLLRIEAPFRSLEAVNFAFDPFGTPCASKPLGSEKASQCISVVIPTLGQTIELYKDQSGSFDGTALFDLSTLSTSTLTYYFMVNGSNTANATYTLTSADKTNGVATVPAGGLTLSPVHILTPH